MNKKAILIGLAASAALFLAYNKIPMVRKLLGGPVG